MQVGLFTKKSSHFLHFYEPDNLFNINFLNATTKSKKLGVALRNYAVALTKKREK